MESEEVQLEFPSIFSRQPSFVRAIPSHEDDDDDFSDSDPLFETPHNIQNVQKIQTLNHFSSNSDSLSSVSNDSFVSGEEEFESFVNDPDEETYEKSAFDGQNGVFVSGSRLDNVVVGVPIAKVSHEDEDDDEIQEFDDDDEVVVESGYYGVGSAPRVRVLDGVTLGGDTTDEDVVEPGAVYGEQVEGREVVFGNEEVSNVVVEGEGVKLIEDFTPGNVGEEESVLEMDVEATESDVVRSIVEEDSEAVRCGVVVVGDSGGGEEMGTGVMEVGVIIVGETVTLGNEFETLDGANIEAVELEQEEVLSREDLDVESKEHEVGSELEDVSCADEEKVQLDNEDEEPQFTSRVAESETNADRSYASVLLDEPDAAGSDETRLLEEVEKDETLIPEVVVEVEDSKHHVTHEETDVGDSNMDGEFNHVLSTSQIVTDSDEEEEEADSDEDVEGDDNGVFDSTALAALLKAATSAGSDSGTVTITSQDGSRLFSIERPAGLGTSLPSLRPASRTSYSSLLNPSSLVPPSEENLSEEEKKKLQHMQQLRVKFLRLVQRLGRTSDESIAAQVLYRLALLAGRPASPSFSLENAKQTAMQLEAEGKDDLDFSLNILVLGKAGVGKSATINSIFGEEKVKINAFEPVTTSVQEISGIIDGVKIRVIDAPGLKSSGMEQGFNRKVLASAKKLTKKYPPDVMLYVDRLDSKTRDRNDLPVLRTITSSLGSSIWRSAIVTLTHAASAPPDGPSGSPSSYESFVASRSHIVQQSIGQAVGDLRLMNPSSMNPVSLVENHSACRKNRDGQRVLPNGQVWRPQLLLLCYSLKILSEANSALKPQDPIDRRKLFGFRVRSVPLPYLLSTMLQPHAHPKLSVDQGGDAGDSDIDLDDLSDSDQEEEEDEYDQLPPFKPLRKSQLAKLSGDQRKAYLEEYDYRVKLLQRKQWREELKRMREMKKGKSANGMNAYSETPEDIDAENEAPAAVPVPLPDMVLPPSFDSDNPAYRYRLLEPTSQFLARPVLDTHGWDHDCGYDGVNLEQNLGIAGRFPAAVTVQVTKDKKEYNLHLDSSVSAKHGENGSSLLGFDIQNIGKQSAYIIRGETKSKLLKKNKTGAGMSVTFLGENVATGVKLEDQLHLGKRLVLLGSAGTVRSQKDAAYGANLEVRLRESDYPIGQDQSSLNLSLMKWKGDLAVGGNLQSQFSIGRSSKMAVRVSLNNKLSGQISVRTSSSDHLQLALAGLLPIVLSIYQNFKPHVSDNYSLY